MLHDVGETTSAAVLHDMGETTSGYGLGIQMHTTYGLHTFAYLRIHILPTARAFGSMCMHGYRVRSCGMELQVAVCT